MAKSTSAKLPGSSARDRQAAASGRRTVRHRPDAELDFSDLPELSPAQLRRARRAGRPPQGGTAKQLIAIRVDPALLTALRALAARKKMGYQTFIQHVLAEAVTRHHAA